MVKNQGIKQREQRSVGNGKLTGSVPKETIVVSVHDINKRAKTTQPNPSPSSSSTSEVPNDKILESLYNMRIRVV